jgi:glycosyltransferase involved in cell wall biosynthesis
VIFTEHGRFFPDRSSPKRRFINPLLARLTDQITSISVATKQALVDYEFISPHRISVIYNGLTPPRPNPSLATDLRKQLGMKKSSVVMGTIARLDPIKNHPLLIRAFTEVQKRFSDVRLVIVGDGETRQELEELVDELGVRDSVVFTGYKPEPLGYLEMMDIFLLPSLSEGTSMTLLEAMGLSKPCIVTDVGGNPEIIEHNATGLVTPSDDLPSLIEACLQLVGDESLRTRFGSSANERFMKMFTAETMIARFMELYQKLVA